MVFGNVRNVKTTMSPLLIGLSILVLAGAAFLTHRTYVGANPAQKARRELSESLAKRMLAEKFTDPVSGNVMPYRLFVPPDRKHARLPIVLAMHSGAGRDDDNLRQLDETIAYLLSDALQGIEPTVVLAPQAARRTHWVDYPSFDPPFTNFDQRKIPQSENLKTAIRILREVIDSYDIDPQRVYITGISMGGEGTWDAISYHPELFAAAIPLNGAGDPRAMERVKDLPIKFFHGSEDTITPVANSRDLAAALKAVGAKAQYQEIEGAGHNIRSVVYGRELFAWLLQQKKLN